MGRPVGGCDCKVFHTQIKMDGEHAGSKSPIFRNRSDKRPGLGEIRQTSNLRHKKHFRFGALKAPIPVRENQSSKAD